MSRSEDVPPEEAPEPQPAESIAAPETKAAEDRLAAAEVESARERERWLRHRFEKEHQVLLSMMRLLVAGVSTESRAMRLWRWLIDDFRSERRLLATVNGQREEERLDRGRVLWWFRRKGVEGAGSRP